MNITLGLEVFLSWIKEREERNIFTHYIMVTLTHLSLSLSLHSFILFAKNISLFFLVPLLFSWNERESTSWSNWTPALSSSRKEVLLFLLLKTLFKLEAHNWWSLGSTMQWHTHTHLFSSHCFSNSFNSFIVQREEVFWLTVSFPFSLQSRIWSFFESTKRGLIYERRGKESKGREFVVERVFSRFVDHFSLI